MHFIFFNRLGILPLLVIYMILIEIDFVKIGNIRRCQFSFFKRIPFDICEPGMILDFFIAVISKPFLCASCQTFIDEVSGFFWPACRNLILFYLGLLRYNMFSDFSSGLTKVWPSTEHALPCDHTNCKVVGCNPMIPFAHNFRSHVSWSARCFIRIVNVSNPFSGNTKVCQF